jgi:hypothetical protein
MRVGKCRLHPTLLNDYATVMAELKWWASMHGWVVEVRWHAHACTHVYIYTSTYTHVPIQLHLYMPINV